MIMNDRQYRITKAAADKFRRALDALRVPSGRVHPKLQKIERDALQAQLEDLEAQLKAYAAMRAGKPKLAGSLQDLGGLLVHARIARQWSQQELGDRVGVKMQQIQRYEKTLYESASLTRILEVATALGVDSALTLKLVPLLAGLETAAAVRTK